MYRTSAWHDWTIISYSIELDLGIWLHKPGMLCLAHHKTMHDRADVMDFGKWSGYSARHTRMQDSHSLPALVEALRVVLTPQDDVVLF